jgi:hypothetical protein
MSTTVIDYDTEWKYQSLKREISRVQAKLNKGLSSQKQLSPDIQFKKTLAAFIEDYEVLADELYAIILTDFKDQRSPHALDWEDTSEDQKKEYRRQIVNKLSREWQRISGFISSFYFCISTSDDPFDWLQPLVAAAAQDLGLDQTKFFVLPAFGQSFSLTSFVYSDEFVLLEIPITSIYVPWEWSIIWHEMSGHKVKQILKQDSQAFKNLLSSVAGEDGQLKSIKKSGEHGLGGEASQPFYQQEKWNDGKLQELFEDACSVMSLGPEFPRMLEGFLNRSKSMVNNQFSDGRHPSPEARVEIAKLLVNANSSPDNPDDDFVASFDNFVKKYLPVSTSESTSTLQDKVHNVIIEAIKSYSDDPASGDQITEKAIAGLRAIIPEMQLPTPESVDERIITQILACLENGKSPVEKCQAIIDWRLSDTDWAINTSDLPKMDHAVNDLTAHTVTIHNRMHYVQHSAMSFLERGHSSV